MKTASNQPATPHLMQASPRLRSFSPPDRRRVQHTIEGPSATKQEFTAECDINQILAKYQRTGALSHFARYAPQYGDFTAIDLQEAYALAERAAQMFDDLPSSVRNEVKTPEGFLNFVQDPSNRTRMQELGLTATPIAPIPPPPVTGV